MATCRPCRRTSNGASSRPRRRSTSLPSLSLAFSGKRREAVPMKPLPHNAELLALAERTVWYKPPDQAIADQLNFVAHVLTYGDQDDVTALRRYLDLDDIRESLDRA